MTEIKPVLEPAAQEFVEATARPPYLFDLPVEEGRRPSTPCRTVTSPRRRRHQRGHHRRGTDRRGVDQDLPSRRRRRRPAGRPLHPRRRLGVRRRPHPRPAGARTGRARRGRLVFPEYSRSPEARYPIAIEEIYAALEWVAAKGAEHDLDADRIAVAGDSVGGNMTAALTLMAKQRGGPSLAAQLLFYPVTDATFDTDSYHQFAEGYWLRRDAMQWFWDQYTTDAAQRAEITASPLRATTEQLAGLPPALVIIGEADVLRDEGEAYAAKLRSAGVPVTAVRYQGIIHDFVMVNPCATPTPPRPPPPRAASSCAPPCTTDRPDPQPSTSQETPCPPPHRRPRPRRLRRRRQLRRSYPSCSTTASASSFPPSQPQPRRDAAYIASVVRRSTARSCSSATPTAVR